jgi:glutamate-1-semialdehyde 2,1-aminomutase
LRTLRDLRPYDALETRAARLIDGIVTESRARGIPAVGGAMGAMGGWFFHEGPVLRFEDAQQASAAPFAPFFHACLRRGVFFPPSPYEALFVSTAHDDATVDRTLEIVTAALAEVAG